MRCSRALFLKIWLMVFTCVNDASAQSSDQAAIRSARSIQTKVLEPVPGSNAAPLIYQRQSVSVSVSGNWPLADEEGVWSGYLGKVTGAPVIAGRCSAQWVKRDGKWLIRSEVFVALTCAGGACKYPAVP